MPRVESSILIHAPRERVLAVARDNAAFPEFMADVKSLEVTETSPDGLRIVSDWVGVVQKFGITVRWTEEDVWDLDAGTCTFRQTKGDYDKFDGVWTFTGTGDAETRFDSFLDYELEIPLVGALVKTLVHKIVQTNLDSTLSAIKARSESSD
ncbi:MAG: SRPBCC family protein [Armatimonadetes bacterium]|nr:SRPBCC family protein [Armatimonadota bacterium]